MKMRRPKPPLQLYKTTMHAINILVDRAQADGELISTGELAKRIGISQQNVLKIVSRLARAQLVMCVRGWQGGVRLARPATQITVGDVVRAVERKPAARSEGDRQDLGDDPIFGKAFEAFVSVLNQHTLASVVAKTFDKTSAKASPEPRGVRMPVAKLRRKSPSAIPRREEP